jgi:hypothetical protein
MMYLTRNSEVLRCLAERKNEVVRYLASINDPILIHVFEANQHVHSRLEIRQFKPNVIIDSRCPRFNRETLCGLEPTQQRTVLVRLIGLYFSSLQPFLWT